MKKKLMIISAAAVLALGGLATIAGAIGSGNMSITKAATAHDDHDHSAMVEKAFQAPTTSAEGYKPFYLCSECCASDFRTSRYSVADKDENLADVVIPALTAATTADIASGDGISAINAQKFKYVDQGANKGEASSDKVESTPLFVKDSGKTAIYFSRSGMAATPNNPTGNDGCSEFRFTVPSEAAKSKSVSFSYKYMNWGTGSWAGGTSASEPAGWTALIQFKDSGNYIGHDVSAKLTNDGEWHTLKLDYSGGTTASLTDFIFKFTDLRGYIMVSGLTYEATKDVTLKNVNADGTDGTANVLVGSLPDSPTMDGKTFLGWYDESGNKVESVTSSTATLVARWMVSHYDDNNKAVMEMPDDGTKYAKADGVEGKYNVRTGADRDDDLAKNRYPSTKGAKAFIPGDNNYDNPNGLCLPAFDFSKVSGVRFTFGFNAGVWFGLYLNNTSIGQDKCGQTGFTDYKCKNFEVTITGKNVTVYSKAFDTTYDITLDDDTYSGKKGLEIKTTKCCNAWLFVSPYITLDCDYLSVMSSIEAALPGTPTAGYSDQLKKYKTLSGYMTAYEKANLITSKMQSWLDAADAAATKVLEFTDSGASILQTKTGIGADQASQGSGYTEAENCAQIYVAALDAKYVTLTLPAFDFSQYDKVTFNIGLGGGPGDRGCIYWFGGVTPGSTYTGTGWDSSLASDPNVMVGYNRTAKDTSDASPNWAYTTPFTAITISSGKITFSGVRSAWDDADDAAVEKTYDLSESIYKGTTGLTISVGFCSYNNLIITPFYGSVVSID